MRSSMCGLAAGLILAAVWLTSPALEAAPARAIYFTEFQSIFKTDPVTLETVALFPNAITGSAMFERLYVDAPNGHLYWIDSKKHIHRGNLDGTGATLIYTGTTSFLIKDVVVVPETGNLFIATDRHGVIEYDPVTETSTTRHTVADVRELIGPRLYLNRETSEVYWSEILGSFWTWDAASEMSSRQFLPVAEIYDPGRPHRTDIVFDPDGTPVPYSLGQNSSNLYNGLLVGGLGEDEPTPIPIEQLAPSPAPEIRVDRDAGFIYLLGQTFVDGDAVSGLYRMNLDASELTKLVDVSVRGELAIDTADLDDTSDPQVTIFSPIGGVTNNQSVSLIGSVSDDGVLDSISWSHDGEEQGSVEVFNGDFTVPSISLHPGENLLEIRATDLAGNTGSAGVSLEWQPLRALNVSAPAEVSEGRRSVTTVTLDSAGEVAGATFKLLYDTEEFEAPKYELGEQLEAASPLVNIATPGEVSVTFAKASGTVAAGEHELISVSLRARSVAADSVAGLGVSMQDMADETGNPIIVGTYVGEAEILVLARRFVGDINSNDRLDTGDASRMQAMLTGISPKHPWDDLINDLNGSTTLDSGDVIRVLRAVVGLGEQPAAPAPRSKSGTVLDESLARLVISDPGAVEGETVTVSVQLGGLGEGFSGASFTLDYPSDALRLDGSASHRPGAVVGGDAILLWNLAPSQNDYVNQSGRIAFGASSSSSWPGSSAGGTLASFNFTVAPGAAASALWEISVRDLEFSVDSGFEIMEVGAASTLFVGQPQSFESWRIANFDELELGDLSLSGWGADPDGDRLNNAAEFFTGGDPHQPNASSVLEVGLVPLLDGSGGHCLVASYDRSMTAVGIDAILQTSSDLATWQDLGSEISRSVEVDLEGARETTTVQIVPEADWQFLRLKLSAAVEVE
ncbi:MAG: cohesin domain-containing protein [Verrucomicrobiales bacterium]